MPRIKCDFDGWATKNDIRCTDGRIIRKNAFKDNDGMKVPLVYQHFHDDPSNVLGHAYLENREDGVYAYCCFNNTETAQDAKELVRHGDLDSLSIFANKLKQNGSDVIHGSIKEVSLVLSGANRGAKIQNTYFEHADGSDSMNVEEAIITMGYKLSESYDDYISHADEEKEEKTMADGKERTVQDVIDSMNEEQKKVLYFLLSQAAGEGDEEAKHSDMEGNYMKHNAFEDDYNDGEYIAHSEELKADVLAILNDKTKRGQITSLKDEILCHADTYGIDDIEWLFPDASQLNNTPEFIKREDDWVDTFMSGTKHLPFSRVKVRQADITADEARAKGYTKGNRKTEEVFTLLKRSVTPTTIYKKQKLDRDDIIDITDFDVVVWLKTEMRMMLNEEIARAALVGDGRSTASDDKISETNIIPVWKDDSLYTINVRIPVTASDTDETKANALIKAILKARKNYKGSGNPVFYTTEDTLTDLLLIEDGIGRRKYETEADVARAIRCSKIVTVPVMEGLSRSVTYNGNAETRNLVGIVLNPIDYSFGADKGGAVSMFEDFDIDFNQQKYLIETRCSGMLTKPFSAMAIETTLTT